MMLSIYPFLLLLVAIKIIQGIINLAQNLMSQTLVDSVVKNFR